MKPTKDDREAPESSFVVHLDRVLGNLDSRTTLMIRNIPNKYSQKMLLAAIDEHKFRGTFDFFYLPIDFKNKCNVGYAFINFIQPRHVINFYESFNAKKWEKFNSEKVCQVTYARLQGKLAMIQHFQNSSLMCEDKKYRPVLFHSSGPNEGEPESFPVGPNLRPRRNLSSQRLYQQTASASADDLLALAQTPTGTSEGLAERSHSNSETEHRANMRLSRKRSTGPFAPFGS